jgi:hypothetical protein
MVGLDLVELVLLPDNSRLCLLVKMFEEIFEKRITLDWILASENWSNSDGRVCSPMGNVSWLHLGPLTMAC